jgi:acyl-CoA thioesterase
MHYSEEAQRLAKACAAAMWAGDRASQGLGMTIEKVAPGQARLSMPVTDKMLAPGGACCRGYIFSLADSALAFAANSYGQNAVLQFGDISFDHPAHAGDLLRAEAIVSHRAERRSTCDVRVCTGDGRVVADLRGHLRIVPGSLADDPPRRAE